MIILNLENVSPVHVHPYIISSPGVVIELNLSYDL